MFAMKTVKKEPNLEKYELTEKDILQKIRHVSYRTVGCMRKPDWLKRILHAESIIMNMTPPIQHYLALCTKNLDCHSLETGQDMIFLLKNVRLLTHQLN
jgi:hypothetical protein